MFMDKWSHIMFMDSWQLEVGCVYTLTHTGCLKKKQVIIETFEECVVDWGVITGPALREGLYDYQAGRKLRPIIQQYVTILFPPRGLLAPTPSKLTPPPRSGKRRLAELSTTEWEEEARPSPTTEWRTQPEPLAKSAETQPSMTVEEHENSRWRIR